MRIAQFIQRYPPAFGGSEAYFSRLANHLTARGDRVTIWTTTAERLEEFGQRTVPKRPMSIVEEFGIEVRRYPPLLFPTRRYLLKAASLIPIRSLQTLTLPCNPICPAMWHDAGTFDGPLDAVHATAFPYSFPIRCALRLARRRNVPFFLTPFLHLGDPTNPRDRTRRQYTQSALRYLLQQADGVFVQTPSEREAVINMGVPERRVTLQGLGVDANECTGGNRVAARRVWGITDNQVIVGHLANNSIEKGTVDLLKAAEALWRSGSACRVVLAGPEMPNFRCFWQMFAFKENVVRLGTLSEGQKRDFYAGIDLFALPSRSDSFGLVLLEAWANAKPVVAYRAGGPADLVRNNTDGVLAACGDIPGLAYGIEILISNANIRLQMGEAGQQRVPHGFAWTDKLQLVRDTIAASVTA